MADRTILMRQKLREGLEKEGTLPKAHIDISTNLMFAHFAGSKRNWSHITGQIGMFCFSGLNEPQVRQLYITFSMQSCVHILGSTTEG